MYTAVLKALRKVSSPHVYMHDMCRRVSIYSSAVPGGKTAIVSYYATVLASVFMALDEMSRRGSSLIEGCCLVGMAVS